MIHYSFNSIKFLNLLIVFVALASCNQDETPELDCMVAGEVVLEYTDTDGRVIRVFDNGDAYIVDGDECNFAVQFFDPGFFSQNYVETDSGTVLIAGDNLYFKPFQSFTEDFEGVTEPLGFFITDIDDRSNFFSAFTMQSPSAKTVDAYVALRQCIFDGSCDFIDNRFDLVPDPTDATNQVLKFFSVAPTSDMVTSKSSISSTLAFFQEGDDFWYEARYYIEDVLPTTIADFESSFFEGSPGPRLIFKGDHLAVENKFNEKITYRQQTGNEVAFPLNEWVKVKMHLRYALEGGIIQVWQNDQLIIDEVGQNIPLDFWIQDRVEVGLTATSDEGVLFIDDIRFDHKSF